MKLRLKEVYTKLLDRKSLSYYVLNYWARISIVKYYFI